MKSSQEIENIKIGCQIGQGNYSTVFLGKDTRDNSIVALKRIQQNRLSEKEREKIDAEIAMLYTFNNPHIMKLLDSKTTGDYIYIVLEYCHAGDLQKIISNSYPRGFPEELVQMITQQLAQGLIDIRSQNIVHRDLKLENILINNKIDIKIADFGFAKVLEQNGMKSFAGTPLTMAPEVLKNEEYDDKCDI